MSKGPGLMAAPGRQGGDGMRSLGDASRGPGDRGGHPATLFVGCPLLCG
jgi:hypothetical protein